jgi:uncharacterized membrane protein
MSETERLDHLERRLSALEEQVRALAMGKGRSWEAGKTRSQPAASIRQSTPPRSKIAASSRPRFFASALSSEQWIGQRLLLAVGVVALILAAGYLLRLSFDRGWISPVMRCVGGLIAGLVVGAIGWRLHRPYRTYGAALIGCGAAIIYLSVWAAARLYGVLPPTTGILYLACMAAGLGFVAARRRWRLTMFVIALSFFGVAYTGAADRGNPWAVLLYGVLGGSVGIYLGLREQWWETRLLSFSGGWTFVAAASRNLDHSWAILVAGLVLALPVWWYGLRTERALPLFSAPPTGVTTWSPGEALYFVLTPLLLGWAVHQLNPAWFDSHRGAVSLLVALPYLFAGYQRPRPSFALIGAAAVGIAAWEHWQGVPRVWALLVLVLLWAAVDHPTTRTDGRWYSLATLWAALQQLFGEALSRRTAADPAFIGSYALALWGTAGVSIALAAGVWRRTAQPGSTPLIQGGLWTLGGALVLFGFTAEIQRYFQLKTLPAYTASLAAGLAVSAWWLLFAATLVALGFRRGLKPVRVAGLTVAGLAVIKVLVFDLSSLDALYRVGSVFILGLVFLLLAYLYHRQGRSSVGQPGGTSL